MKDLFVPYELAVKLSENGFNQVCLSAYQKSGEILWSPSNNPAITNSKLNEYYTSEDVPESKAIAAPLWQQVIDWLREEKNIYLDIVNDYDRMLGYNRGFTPRVNGWFIYNDGDCYESYYSALQSGIEKSLELI